MNSLARSTDATLAQRITTAPLLAAADATHARVHDWLGEIAGTYIRGKHGFTYIWGNRDFQTGNLSDVSAEFSNLLLATDDKEYWYRGVYLKFERQLAERWGFTLTYTLSKAEQRGNDAFSLDFFTVKDYPRIPTPDDERHRIVATGIVRVPWDVTFSSNLILGSGLSAREIQGQQTADAQQAGLKWQRVSLVVRPARA